MPLLRLLALVFQALPFVVGHHVEPAFERASRHAVAGGQDASQMIAVHCDVVAIENEVALQRDEYHLIFEVGEGQIVVVDKREYNIVRMEGQRSEEHTSEL